MKKKLTIIGFFVAIFIVGLDSFIISSLLVPIADSFNATISQVGFGVSIYALFYAVGAPIIAPFSEKLPRKVMMILGLSFFTISTFLCGFSQDITMFYCFRALAGLGAAMFTPNVYAYIGNNFEAKQIGKIMGIVMSALSLSIAIGVPIGSFIASLSSWHWTFFISGGCALFAFILIIIFVEKDTVNTKVIGSNPIQHYKNVFSSKKAVLGLMMMLFWMYAFYAMYTYLGTQIGQQFSFSTSQVGLVFIAYGLSNFVSSFFGGWIGHALGMKKTILIAGLTCCISYIGLGITVNNVSLFIIILAVVAFAQGLAAPQLTTFNATILPESRATMTSLNSSFLYLGLTLGSSFGGFIFEKYSFLYLCIISMVSTFIAILISQTTTKQY